MSQDAYVSYEYRADQSHRIKPVFDDAIFEVEPDAGAAVRVFNKMMVGGRTKDVSDQKYTVQSSLPYRPQVTITTGATLTANSPGNLVITEYARLKKGHTIYIPDLDLMLRVQADPTTSTVSVMSMVTIVVPDASTGFSGARAAFQAGTYGTGGATGSEGWDSPTPLSRGTGTYEDYISTVQHKEGITWHSMHTGMYGINEWARIQKNAKRDWDQAINRELWVSQPRDGSTNGDFRMAGLLYKGNRWNRNTCSGTLTPKFLNKALYAWKKKHGLTSGIECYGGADLVSALATFSYRSGIPRRDLGDPKNTFGEKAGMLTNPWGMQDLGIEMDNIFDELGMTDKLVFVAWPLIKAAKFGDVPYEVKPSSARPEGSATLDTGFIATTGTRTIGFWDSYPQASVMIIDGITNGFEAA